jgi:rfaE bifunctional protein kinase chain/domain
MISSRFDAITTRYSSMHLAVIGDFCLDRYFDIDPGRAETSIETGLPVHNVVGTRCFPGAAGTILNNLVALGVGTLWPVGFCGDDAEGWELNRALRAKPGVQLDRFVTTPERKTFTYTKPLLHRPGQPPEELSRLDQKNWTATPAGVSEQIIRAVKAVATDADALIVLDQVDAAGTGVVTEAVLRAVSEIAAARPQLPILADSRRGLGGFPPVIFKMNAAELAALSGASAATSLATVQQRAAALARKNGQPVFITLSERGIVGASAAGETWHSRCLPIRGPIDIVGAGDSVTANLTAALAAGATIPEALELAMAAASIVIHQLGTTGTASVPEIAERLGSAAL